jgi:hypothetical protein
MSADLNEAVDILRRATRSAVRIERVAPGQPALTPANHDAKPETFGEVLDRAAAPVASHEPADPRRAATAPSEDLATSAEPQPVDAAVPAAAEPTLSEARADLPAPAIQHTSAASATATSAAVPRSPLVHAALDRILPLPSVAGETIVRLNPHGLGLIEVAVHERQDGGLDVALRVQNPMVLEAMRHEREAMAQAMSSAQGSGSGSLSMDLFQSGTGQRGAEPEASGGFLAASADAGTEPAEAQTEDPAMQILHADRVNIVT